MPARHSPEVPRFYGCGSREFWEDCRGSEMVFRVPFSIYFFLFKIWGINFKGGISREKPGEPGGIPQKAREREIEGGLGQLLSLRPLLSRLSLPGNTKTTTTLSRRLSHYTGKQSSENRRLASEREREKERKRTRVTPFITPCRGRVTPSPLIKERPQFPRWTETTRERLGRGGGT